MSRLLIVLVAVLLVGVFHVNAQEEEKVCKYTVVRADNLEAHEWVWDCALVPTEAEVLDVANNSFVSFRADSACPSRF